MKQSIIIQASDFITPADPQLSTCWSYLTNEDNQPINGDIEINIDSITITTAADRFILCLNLPMGDIGNVMTRTSTIINSRNNSVLNLLDLLIQERKSRINSLLQDPTHNLEFQQLSGQPNSLAKLHSLMWLGEELLLNIASKSANRKTLPIHGQSFRILEDKKIQQIHSNTFAGGNIPLYFFLTNPTSRDQFEWDMIDKIVNILQKNNMPIKGHPLVWLHGASLPNWMKSQTFPQLRKFINTRTETILKRYGNTVSAWDLTNEFPTQDSNFFNLNNAQLLTLTRDVAQLVKTITPQAESIINISDIFGGKSYNHNFPSIPPETYLTELIKENIPFYSIGLQFYIGMRKEFVCREFLDIYERLSDFDKLGKKVHLSEIGWPSQSAVDTGCFFSDDHPSVAGHWHRPWDEELQKEFFLNLYNVFKSLNNSKTITWWDTSDYGINQNIGSRFIPFGGITRKDFSEKPITQAIKYINQQTKLNQ